MPLYTATLYISVFVCTNCTLTRGAPRPLGKKKFKARNTNFKLEVAPIILCHYRRSSFTARDFMTPSLTLIASFADGNVSQF